MSKVLAAISALDREGFIALFEPAYEASPWVAAAAFGAAPFQTYDELRAAMRQAVDTASLAERLMLIRAHPELAGEKLRQRTLTPASLSEQARAGLDQLGEADIREWAQLNTQYRERFDFPFVICVRLHSRDQILAAMRSRLRSSPATETAEAIRQIHEIARLRIDDVIARLDE